MELKQRRYSYGDIIALPFRCAPGWTALSIFLRLSSGVTTTLEILSTAWFLDTVGLILRGAVAAEAILLPIALMVAATAWNQIVPWQIGALIRARLRAVLHGTLRGALTDKRSRLKYRFIEDTDAWDLIRRACKEPEDGALKGLDALTGLADLVIRVAGVMILLITRAWWAALIILAITVPLTVLAMKSGKASYQADRDNTKIKRKYEYLSGVLMGRESTAERTLFGYGEKLNHDYKMAFDAAYRHSFGVRLKWFGRRAVSGLIFALVALCVTAVLLPAALSGALSFGLFVSLANAVTGMVNMVAWMLGNYVDAIVRRREALRDLGDFLALEETPGACDLPDASLDFERLELRDVRFTYPGTQHEILCGITLTIEKGGHYAFVGVNGAGKTTLTKIVTGLYDEYEGEILLNGRELRTYTPAQLKGCFSLVYQDFARYNIPVRDNVAFDVPGRPARVGEALAVVGLEEAVAKLPDGSDTPLGKVEGEGHDLSGGEWQRLAMARAVANPAPVRILDEPTAALDPIGESRVYEEFERISRGTTTVFISHRLGSTALADTIYVLGDGRILEQGDHAALMARGGLYAEMYASQRSWYE